MPRRYERDTAVGSAGSSLPNTSGLDRPLRAGDLATYQTEIEAAQQATAQAQQLIAGLLGVDTAPSPSPSPSG